MTVFRATLGRVGAKWNREHVERNRELSARHYNANRDKIVRNRYWTSHSMRPEQWADLWQAQDGRCYLCGELFDPTMRIVIDHDHAHCPPQKSCSYCRRGLAHDSCNTAIALLRDDPDLIMRVSIALGAAKYRVEIATKPLQDELSL